METQIIRCHFGLLVTKLQKEAILMNNLIYYLRSIEPKKFCHFNFSRPSHPEINFNYVDPKRRRFSQPSTAAEDSGSLSPTLLTAERKDRKTHVNYTARFVRRLSPGVSTILNNAVPSITNFVNHLRYI